MTIDQIITTIALILGPVSAVVVTIQMQKRNAAKAQQLWVFQTLMTYRGDLFSSERIKALGMIDVAFHTVQPIRGKWKEYYDSLNDSKYAGGNNDAINTFRRKQNEMLSEMAQFLGYGKHIKYEEIERVYAPLFQSENNERAKKLADEALRVLQNSESFGTQRRS